MSVLTTNFKLHYQRRAMWLVYVIIGMFFMPFFSCILSGKFIRSHRVFLFNALLGVLCLGVVCASLWKDVLGKSFTFSLPGSLTVPRGMFLLFGGVINFFVSLLFAYSRWPETFFAALQAFFPIFFIGMGFFLVGVLATYQSTVNNLWACLALLFLLIPFTAVIEDILVAHLLIVTPVGIGMCIFTWFWTGRKNLRRTICTTPSITMFVNWNVSKVKQIKEQRAARKANPSDERRRDRREGFFLSRMKQYDVYSVGRYCWGWLYRIFGNPGHKIGLGLIVWLLLVAFFAFMPLPTMQWWIFLMPTIIAGMNLPLPVKHSLLLPVGRKDCYRTILILLPLYTLLVLSCIVIVGLFWQAIHILVPQITVSERTINSTSFQWPYLIVTSFSLPLCFIIRRFIPRGNAISRMLGAFILIMAIVPPWMTIVSGYPDVIETFYAILIVLTVLLWPLCFLAYRNYFQKSKLTWEGRG